MTDVLVSMGLILHELATNAAKYGAFAKSEGKVLLNWWVEAGDLHFRWQERDGPLVESLDDTGFGTTLIQESTNYDLGGQAKLDFRHDGLICDLTFPVGMEDVNDAAGIA